MSLVLKNKEIDISGLVPELKDALMLKIEPAFSKINLNTVITSGRERYKHSTKYSRHYAGMAVDIRSKTVTNKERLQTNLKRRLGKDFKVLLEGKGKPWEHYHISYAPTWTE